MQKPIGDGHTASPQNNEGFLRAESFLVGLEEGILGNLFGSVKVANLPLREGMNASLILFSLRNQTPCHRPIKCDE